MTDLRLLWMRDEEGVIAIYATDENGHKGAVADFWTGPMCQRIGIKRAEAKAIQQRLAECLVETWNGDARTISTVSDAVKLIQRQRYSTVEPGLSAAEGKSGEDAVTCFLNALR